MRRSETDNQGYGFDGLASAFDDGSGTTTPDITPRPPVGDHDTHVALPSTSPLSGGMPGHVNLTGAGGYAPVTLLDYLQGARGMNLGGMNSPTQGGMVGSSKADGDNGTSYANLGYTASADGKNPGMGAYVGGGYTTGMGSVDNYVYGNRSALATPAAPTGQPAPTAAAPAPAPTLPPPTTGPMAPRGGSVQDTSDTQDAQRYRGLQGSFGSY